MKAPQPITTGVSAHPAVRAWLSLAVGHDAGTRTAPSHLELLYESPKSRVYRLAGLAPGGGAVIAKRSRLERSRLERDVYLLLQRLGCATLDYYGSVENPGDDMSWLFLEEAAGEVFDPARPQHLQLAARWLAQLHTRSARLGASPALPERGAAHYLEHLHAGRAVLLRSQRQLAANERAVLDAVHRVLDRTESHWASVDEASRDMPWAFVHADFVRKNIRVRNGAGSSSTLVPFDWEYSGWGPVAVDLALADLDVYHAGVRRTWPQLDRRALERLAHVGTLLRGGTASVHWESEHLEQGWLDNIIGNMRIYTQRMNAALDALGWRP